MKHDGMKTHLTNAEAEKRAAKIREMARRGMPHRVIANLLCMPRSSVSFYLSAKCKAGK